MEIQDINFIIIQEMEIFIITGDMLFIRRSMNTKISVVIVMVIMLFICSQGNIVNAETVKLIQTDLKLLLLKRVKSAKLCNLSMKK